MNNSEKYKELAQEYNLHELDCIYNDLIKTGSDVENKELAEHGYLELLNWMNYDFACGKLDLQGIELMPGIVEKAENLVKHKLWYDRGLSFQNLMTAYLEMDLYKADEYGRAGIEAYTRHIEEEGEFSLSAWSSLSEIYENYVKFFPESRVENFRNAVMCLHKMVEFNPLRASWFIFLKLLYLDYPNEDEKFKELRIKEREIFHNLCIKCVGDKRELTNELTLNYKRFFDLLNWKDQYSGFFPETDYLYWLEKSKESPVADLYLPLSEMGSLYYNEGKRLRRKDLLLASIDRYHKLIAIENEKPAFPVMYVAWAMEELASQYREEGNPEKARDYLNEVRQLYLSYFEKIKENFSVLVHYGEFLERCLYEYPGDHDKPTPDEMLEVAKLAEKEGKGYYAGPEMLLIRISLRTGDPNKAIFYLTRLLLLHELCINNELKQLREQPFCASNTVVCIFIDETLCFMESIKEGYYLDGTMKWEELESMSPEELKTAWNKRRILLANREKLKFD